MSEDLKKYTLVHDDKKGDWALKSDDSGRTRARFDTKQDATKGGVLSDALGKPGGSVKIQKTDGRYQEERTFPRSKDPKGSKG
jgi:hypothetical protein